MKIWLTRLTLFIIMAALLLYMGHRPTEWEYWAVIGCGVGLAFVGYVDGKKGSDFMSSVLQQCCDDAWDVIKGRKRIVGNRIVDVKQVHDIEEDSKSTDYGWLSPKGEFYPVEFGNHQAWAADYLLSLYRDGKISYDKAKISNENAGDSLIEMGWILIHNPSRQRIEISKNESKTETKPQKEFLYDFFRERGMIERASKLYEE